MWVEIAKIAVGAIALIAAAYFVSKFWKNIRETVAAWLRARGLQESALMDAWVVLDNLVTVIRRKIFVKAKQTGEQKISETTHTLDEIRESDPDVYAEIEKRGQVKQNIMHLFH